ncbi:MAG: rRNA maturation RNase YbeY [Tissierellia bacterium]|nr:rRNA maturation RNase YbeY [Tissierellia bacterium]
MVEGRIYIDNRQNIREISNETLEFLEDVITKALGIEGVFPPWEVSVSIVEPDEIREINHEFRGIDKITDVLSFPLEEELPDGTKVLGDIIINMDRVMEQAKEFGHSEQRELSYLTVHSLLHLLGYDHEDQKERTLMRDREKVIMEFLGINREEGP